MKVALIGSPRFDSMEFHMADAFRHAGHEAKIFDVFEGAFFEYGGKYARFIDNILRQSSDAYEQRLFKGIAMRVNTYDADLIICFYRFIHPMFVKAVKRRKNRVIQVNPDTLTTLQKQQIFASNYDVWFTKDPFMQRFMHDGMKLNAKLYNEAFNVRYHKRPEINKEECEKKVGIDVMTYGTMYPYRCRMLVNLIKAGINIKVFGVRPNRIYDQSIDKCFQNKYITGEEKSKILYGSKIVFNQMYFAEIEGMDCRFFEVNGCGAFQLSDYRPILHDLLPKEVSAESVSFKSVDEGIDKVKYYLSHDAERYEIAGVIYKHFINNYSYDHLVRYILANLD